MSTGARLIHGFTATPACMETLAEPLRKAGFLVEAPLLAGHGTTARDLFKTTWTDWYQSVREAYEKLRSKTDSVCVAGLSLGGLLALKLALDCPVERLALLATPVIFTGFVMEKIVPIVGGSPALSSLYRYQPKFGGPAINDPEGRERFKSYTKMPLRSVMEIIRLQQDIRPRLSEIKIPVLILHSSHDSTAPYANMDYFKSHLGSKNIRAVTLEKSDHVITLDYERDLVAREVSQFFKAG